MTHILSYNHLGNYGRLGNQMFQYAALCAAAKNLGMRPMANLSNSDLTKCFKLGFVEDGVNRPQSVYSERDFFYTGDLFILPVDRDIDVVGYFQSEKNFGEHDALIREQFEFVSEISDKCHELIPEEPCVSLHVRRGDYLQLSDTHTNMDREYYEQAMSECKNQRPLVFSDDPEWCKQEMKWLGEDAIFFSNSQEIDLCLMTLCNSHIIANSSFSWGGAYLGGGSTYAPKNWFAERGPKDWKDIYGEGWNVI